MDDCHMLNHSYLTVWHRYGNVRFCTRYSRIIYPCLDTDTFRWFVVICLYFKVFPKTISTSQTSYGNVRYDKFSYSLTAPSTQISNGIAVNCTNLGYTFANDLQSISAPTPRWHSAVIYHKIYVMQKYWLIVKQNGWTWKFLKWHLIYLPIIVSKAKRFK